MHRIRQKYPNHLFVGEESVSMGNSEEVVTDGPTWIIDRILYLFLSFEN